MSESVPLRVTAPRSVPRPDGINLKSVRHTGRPQPGVDWIGCCSAICGCCRCGFQCRLLKASTRGWCLRALLSALPSGLSRPGLARRCWLRFRAAYRGWGLRSVAGCASQAAASRGRGLRGVAGCASWASCARPERCRLCVRAAFAIFVCLRLCLVFRRPALALGAGSQAESDHYLTIT